jgi:hypothetical protein
MPSWDEIRNGIFAGESGGDYNALFGFSNRPGGKFAGTNLTNMTLDDVLNFADPSGPYGQWVKSQIGRVATPLGGYQVVGSTLRAAKDALGLTGKEPFDQALQDKIAQHVLQTQGTGAWEGYKGPRLEGSGLRHVGGAGSAPGYFAPKPGTSVYGTPATPADGTPPPLPAEKPKNKGDVLGEGFQSMADAMGYKPLPVPDQRQSSPMGGGGNIPSVFRSQLLPTSVAAGMGGMGNQGGQDLRAVLAQLLGGIA